MKQGAKNRRAYQFGSRVRIKLKIAKPPIFEWGQWYKFQLCVGCACRCCRLELRSNSKRYIVCKELNRWKKAKINDIDCNAIQIEKHSVFCISVWLGKRNKLIVSSYKWYFFIAAFSEAVLVRSWLLSSSSQGTHKWHNI